VIHLMMRTESSKDNVTETSLLLKQELDNTSKLKLKRTKKKKLQRARKFLKNSSCLEDTSLDCNKSSAGQHVLHLLFIYYTKPHKTSKTYYFLSKISLK